MNPTPQHIDRAERFLTGALSAEERQAFLEDLTSDPDLRSALKILDALATGLEQGAVDGKSGSVLLMQRKPWLVAAIIGFLILVSVGIWFAIPSSSSPEQLFMAYYEPYPIDVLVRSNKGPVPDEEFMRTIRQKYQSAQWVDAMISLKAQVDLTPSAPAPRFYLAQTLLNQDENAALEAIPILRSLTKEQTAFQNMAKWYLALAFIKVDSLESARETLIQISENHSKSLQAKEILSQLDSR